MKSKWRVKGRRDGKILKGFEEFQRGEEKGLEKLGENRDGRRGTEGVCVGCGLKAADFPRLLPEAVTHSALIRVQCHQVETHALTYACTHTHTRTRSSEGISKCRCVFLLQHFNVSVLSLQKWGFAICTNHLRDRFYTRVQMSEHAVTLFSHTNKAILR